MAEYRHDEELRLRLAQELENVRHMLDLMGEQLSADLDVLRTHGVSLQTVDIAGQILGHIAAIVRSNDPDAAVERIGMCELRARLEKQAAA
jgi:hypothetical protein